MFLIKKGNGHGLGCLVLSSGLDFSGYSLKPFVGGLFIAPPSNKGSHTDPTMEPPMLVINTVLSLIAYDYPTDKLSILLSDDAGLVLTFYALLEASHFSKHWIPFCKRFKVNPRAPATYFNTTSGPHDLHCNEEWSTIKKLYAEMESRIKSVVKLGQVSQEIQVKHRGFSEWKLVIDTSNHQTILLILIDGRDPNAVDNEGRPLPTLVYLAREKRLRHNHHFKAGALYALVNFLTLNILKHSRVIE